MTTTQQIRPGHDTRTVADLPARRFDATHSDLTTQNDLADLARNGLPGQAQALDLRETGSFLDREPVLEVRLSVRVAGGAPYPAIFVGPISEPGLGRAQDGLPFAARIDPKRPDRVLVDWSV